MQSRIWISQQNAEDKNVYRCYDSIYQKLKIRQNFYYTVRDPNTDSKTIKKIKCMIISKFKTAISGRSNTKSAHLVPLLDLNVSYTGMYFIITSQVVYSSLCTFLVFVSLIFHSKNVTIWNNFQQKWNNFGPPDLSTKVSCKSKYKSDEEREGY